MANKILVQAFTCMHIRHIHAYRNRVGESGTHEALNHKLRITSRQLNSSRGCGTAGFFDALSRFSDLFRTSSAEKWCNPVATQAGQVVPSFRRHEAVALIAWFRDFMGSKTGMKLWPGPMWADPELAYPDTTQKCSHFIEKPMVWKYQSISGTAMDFKNKSLMFLVAFRNLNSQC